jgi:LmbE family N-acetylglucosaminyl deacetylase
VIVVSTHLDDAVWSAAGLCEGSTVVTICAGVPPEGAAPSTFDVASGFETGADAMLQRRVEDRYAARLLRATPLHCDVLDGAYGRENGAVCEAVEKALFSVRSEEVAGPLGIGHPDHREVASAFIGISRERGLDAWLYADLPYTRMAEHQHEFRAKLSELGITRSRGNRIPEELKRAAVTAYKSQIRPSTHLREILGSELYLKL